MATKKKKTQTKTAQTNTGWVVAQSSIIVGIIILVVASALLLGWRIARNDDKSSACITFKLPVALAEGKAADQVVSGEYCQPTKWAEGERQVDVLTPGAGYNHTYFDWPMQSDKYSYVIKTLDAGRAAFAYDRIGTGQSSRPESTSITLASDAYVLHQIVQAFRLTGYKQVNSVGHSYGSAVVVQEAGTYNDVTRVIATGFLHNARNPEIAKVNHPANQDPLFSGAKLDAGYLTSKPGARGGAFYASSADKAVIAYDNDHRDLISQTAFGGYVAQQQAPADNNISDKITVPVLLVVGQKDFIFCHDSKALDCTNTNAIKNQEAPYYPAAKSLTVVTAADTGHDLTLHPSANQSFNSIDTWIKAN